MDIQLAIFDLDGVIVNTAQYHYAAWRRLAQNLGFEFTEEHNEHLKGVSRMRSLEILLEVGGLEKTSQEKEALAAQKNKWYVEYITKMDASEILPGVIPFLREVEQAGIKTALGSASKNARTILNRIKLENYFDVIVDGTLVTKAKPDPEVFLLASEKLQISPEQCVVFEDANAGIEAGLRAGMYTVGIGDRKILQNAHLVLPGFAGLSLDRLLGML